MKLRELLPLIESSITIELEGVKEKYDSRSDFPQDRMDHVVRMIEAYNGSLLITLDEPKKAAGLEELGYRFESGM